MYTSYSAITVMLYCVYCTSWLLWLLCFSVLLFCSRIISLRLVSSIDTKQTTSNHDNISVRTPPTSEAPPTMMDTSIAAQFQSTAPSSHDSPSFMNDALAM